MAYLLRPTCYARPRRIPALTSRVRWAAVKARAGPAPPGAVQAAQNAGHVQLGRVQVGAGARRRPGHARGGGLCGPVA
eukprot:821379-Rhodomonas_salina.2